MQKNRVQVSGCSKRFLRHGDMEDLYEMDYYEQEDYDEDITDCDTDTRTPVVLTLSDFTQPSINPFRTRIR